MIKFRHRNCDQAFTPATFSYEVPPAHLFEFLVKHSETIINFPFGVTYLHPLDQYSRAKGREMAQKDHSVKRFYLNKVYVRNGRTYFELLTAGAIEVTFSVDFDRDLVRLEYVDLLSVSSKYKHLDLFV